MLYQIINGTVSAGGHTILSKINFEIRGNEKIAVIGRNGAGKTTLLRLIFGELELDRDDKQEGKQIQCSRKITIGMLTQHPQVLPGQTVEDLLLEHCQESDKFSKERFAYEMEYRRIFTNFGFSLEEIKRQFSSFSGGEQTKISLICLLLQKPDLMLLDEPTNHLDVKTTEWLELYMKKYEKAVVFVSHDRYFLDQVVDVVYEVSGGTLTRYAGNYSEYRIQKQKQIAIQTKAYERQQEEITRLNQLIESFKHKPKKAAFARSRKTILNRMERIEKPEVDDAHIFTSTMEPLIIGPKWVYEAEKLHIGYEKTILELSLRIRRGQKIGIIGDNGVGKTTFLKTVAGLIKPLSGKWSMGNQVMFGYFDQQSAAIHSEKTVVEHFHDLFPAMTEKEVRQTLGNYLFRGKMSSVRVDDLSGGEKARLVLAELLTGKPNFLILDEPTNHMDIEAKETLESAFNAYSGTILFVSHDRYFIRQVADAILLFEDNGAMYYPFGYEHYQQKRKQGTGMELSALMRAEEQAMIEDFKAIPKKETGMLRRIGTEEAYRDWQLRIASEPLWEAKEQVEFLWKEKMELIEQQQMQQMENWKFDHSTINGDKIVEVEKQLENALLKWTEACMTWYDIWSEIYL